MKEIKITDITLRESEQLYASGLSFKEKIEIAKLLEKLNVDAIEVGRLSATPADAVLLRTLAATVRRSALCVPVGLDRDEISRVWSELQKADSPRINIIVPTSTVQMEYVYHIKPRNVIGMITDVVTYAASLGCSVEFTAADATRSEWDFLISVISAAIDAGADIITVCDTAGEMLPGELGEFISSVCGGVSNMSKAVLSVQCKDSLGLAAADALAAIDAGATQLKATFSGSSGYLAIGQIMHLLAAKGDDIGVESSLNAGEWQRICRQLESLTGINRNGHSAFGTTVGTVSTENSTENELLSADADKLTVRRRVTALGYDVTDEDMEHIYFLFRELAAKKRVDNRDLEALVAEAARQVPPTYKLENYVINSGSSITATACMQIMRDGELLQALSLGDGPIDASFLAIEQVLGHHFELEDFKIRAVTEGREALGDALVKLRSNGKLYSGRGLSTDIIGAAIRAYLSAVNKIVYEEKSI